MLRDGNRRVFGRSAGNSPAFFLPLNDLGGGQVNIVPGISAPGSTGTFTRATSATCWGPTGLLITVGSGVARSTYTELTGATYLGYMAEEARTNSCLQNRDFTNAAWTATTMTTAKDQVGIDGVANSASSLLATAGNATVSQSITIAAVNRPFSVYVKRLTGTGNIDLAQDGATFTTQSVANDGAWHRCTLAASQLNPTLTIRLATNGDKIAVDFAMLEDSGGAARTTAGTPIATTTVAVTRNGDALAFPLANNASNSEGTAYCEASPTTNSGGSTRLIGSSTALLAVGINTTTTTLGFNGTDPTVTSPSDATFNNGTPHKCATTWSRSGNVWQAFLSGSGGTPHTFGATGVFGTDIRVGSQAATSQPNAPIKNVKIWLRALSAGEVAAL